MTIMIIDDDLDDSFLFKEVIVDIAPKVCCLIANSCEEAISTINEASAAPDIIFLDAYMYPLGGKESLLMLNKIEKLADARIIIHSGALSGSQVNEFKILGADDVMTKADSKVSLEKMLRSVLAS
jgi:response regulator of citrate/malate metabolism